MTRGSKTKRHEKMTTCLDTCLPECKERAQTARSAGAQSFAHFRDRVGNARVRVAAGKNKESLLGAAVNAPTFWQFSALALVRGR